MIFLSRKADKFLAKVSKKEHGQLWERIEDLQNNPRPNDSIHMTGYPDCFRIDVGEFRVIYKFEATKPAASRERVPAKRAAPDPKPTSVIRVAVVGRRNDKAAYKTLKRVMGRG